jgi:hypothetical protein
MNIELFRKHTASRKAVPIPLKTKKIVFKPPPLYTDCPKSGKYVRLEPCRVTHIDINKPTQTIILDLKNPEKFNLWIQKTFKTITKQFVDVKITRFQRAFGGMKNPSLRYWIYKNGNLEQTKTRIQPGDIVQCSFEPKMSKNNMYFNLQRDIIIIKQNKTKNYQYFSDEE